jgi:uncharacterized membrane protein
MNALKISYALAILCFALQFVLLFVGTFDRPDIELNSFSVIISGLLIVLIKAVPWLVLLPGLIMRSAKIMAWMSYVCLVYFIIWILAAFGESQSNLGTLGVLLTLVQFSASAFYTRLKKNSANIKTP